MEMNAYNGFHHSGPKQDITQGLQLLSEQTSMLYGTVLTNEMHAWYVE